MKGLNFKNSIKIDLTMLNILIIIRMIFQIYLKFTNLKAYHYFLAIIYHNYLIIHAIHYHLIRIYQFHLLKNRFPHPTHK